MFHVQILANGIISGLVLAVLALGFTTIYLPTRIFAIALAGVYTLAPYVAWSLVNRGVPWPISTIASLATGVGICVALEWTNHRRLVRKVASESAHLVASLGAYIVLVEIVVILWGSETKVLRAGIDATVTLGTAILTRSQLISAGVSGLLLVGFYLWLRFTHLGLQFRALADNPIQLALYGYNIDWLRLLASGMAGFLVSIASLLTAHDLGFSPHTGLNALLLAIVAMIVGGSRSFLAPIIGGILIGVLRSEVVWYLSARWQEAATFLLLVLILLFRPQGLLGRRQRLEAQA